MQTIKAQQDDPPLTNAMTRQSTFGQSYDDLFSKEIDNHKDNLPSAEVMTIYSLRRLTITKEWHGDQSSEKWKESEE